MLAMSITTIHKVLLASLLSLMGSGMVTLSATSETGAEAIMDALPAKEIRITKSGLNIRVQNAGGQTLEIFNITGKRISTCKIDSNDKTVTLNQGERCYILRINKFVRKISVP